MSISKKYYKDHIPKCCGLQTLKEHEEMMFCWSLLCDMERGMETKNKECNKECDSNKNHDPILLQRILGGG